MIIKESWKKKKKKRKTKEKEKDKRGRNLRTYKERQRRNIDRWKAEGREKKKQKIIRFEKTKIKKIYVSFSEQITAKEKNERNEVCWEFWWDILKRPKWRIEIMVKTSQDLTSFRYGPVCSIYLQRSNRTKP